MVQNDPNNGLHITMRRFQRLKNQFNVKPTIKDNLTDSETIESNLLLYLKETTLYNNI